MYLNNLMIQNISFATYAKTQELCQLNLIVGKNGVGKTHLLKAISELMNDNVNVNYQHIHKNSFSSEDLQSLIAQWKSISKHHPHVRGYILKILSEATHDFVDFDLEHSEYDDELFIEFGSHENRISFNDMNSGFKRAFEICVKAWSVENGLVLIDDIDLHLGRSVQEPLWTYIAKVAHARHSRFFVTTHSGDAITAFAKTTSNDGNICGLLIRLGHSVRVTSFNDHMASKGSLITTVFNEQELIDLHALGLDARG